MTPRDQFCSRTGSIEFTGRVPESVSDGRLRTKSYETRVVAVVAPRDSR